MSGIRFWVRRHSLVSFFIVTFGITFGLWFSFDAMTGEDKFWLIPLASIAICGPGLAGIIVTRLSSEGPATSPARATWIAFLVSLFLATLVFVLHNTVVNEAPLPFDEPVQLTFMLVLLVIMAVPVAFILSQTHSRRPSVRRYLASLLRLRPVWGWLLLAPVVMAGLGVLSIVVSKQLGRPGDFSDLPAQGGELIVLVVLTFLYQIFFFNLTGEEIGWRGFALPRLQAITSPLIASLALTLFWAFWHLFYFRAGGDPVWTWAFWQDTLIRLFPATVLINWFYIRSGGSILVAGVAHAAGNTVFAYMPGLDWPVHTACIYILALVLIIADKMWRMLPADHPAVVKENFAGPSGMLVEAAETRTSNA